MRRFSLIAIAGALFTMLPAKDSFAQKSEKNDTTVIFQDRKVTLHNTKQIDIDSVKDPLGENYRLRYLTVDEPIFINNIPVHKELSPNNNGRKLQKRIVEQLEHSSILQSLPDARVRVRLRNIVVTQKGELAYYELVNISYFNDEWTRTLSDNILTREMLVDAIRSLSWKTDAQYTLLNTDLSRSYFIIKSGKITFKK